MQNIAPCKDCAERSPGCHGKCEPYQAWAAERRRITHKAAELSTIRYTQSDGSLAYIYKRLKSRRK